MSVAAIVGPWPAQVMMPPFWFWLIAFGIWLGLCALAAWPVVRRLGPPSKLALVFPATVGVFAVFLVSSWLRLPLDFWSGLLLSLATSAIVAGLQAWLVKVASGPGPGTLPDPAGPRPAAERGELPTGQP